MAGIDDGIVGEAHKPGADGLHQRLVVPSGQVKPADALGEEGVPGEYYPLPQEAHAPTGVAGGVEDLELEVPHPDCVPVP